MRKEDDLGLKYTKDGDVTDSFVASWYYINTRFGINKFSQVLF